LFERIQTYIPGYLKLFVDVINVLTLQIIFCLVNCMYLTVYTIYIGQSVVDTLNNLLDERNDVSFQDMNEVYIIPYIHLYVHLVQF